jgi:hypothetical protein
LQFLSPFHLWTLAALLPLAAVYFLKVRPRKKQTTAYFLWQKVFSEKRATSLFNRLRDLLSLLLMLLVFTAVAFALARPDFSGDERKDLLVLIDQSASMSADGGSPTGETRLELAKETASDIVLALNGTQRAAVASIGREVMFHSHLSEQPRELLDAIDDVAATVFDLRVEALEKLAADADWSDSYRILLLSDGSFSEERSLPENVELMKIGAPVDNVGLVAADLQRLPSGELGLYFRAASSYSETVEADLVLKHSDGAPAEGEVMTDSSGIFRIIPLTLEPGLNAPEVFRLADAPDGEWRVEIDLEDSLATDNTVWLTSPEPRPVRVLVNAENRFFFETSVLAFETGSGLLQLVTEQPDLVLAAANAGAGDSAALVFTPQGDSPWWQSLGEEIEAIAPRILVEGHPVLRHVDLATVAFVGAREIVPPEGSMVLVESEDGVPLIYRASQAGVTAVIVNLDPLQADFYFSAWFPVLVHNTATHLAGREEALAGVYRPGQSIPVQGAVEGESSEVVAPSGESTMVEEDRFGPVDALGFYRVKNQSGIWPAAVSLLSPADSLLDNSAVEETAEAVSKGQAPSYWLIVLALIVLAAESVMYQRRKVG